MTHHPAEAHFDKAEQLRSIAAYHERQARRARRWAAYCGRWGLHSLARIAGEDAGIFEGKAAEAGRQAMEAEEMGYAVLKAEREPLAGKLNELKGRVWEKVNQSETK